jgi:ArsR family transcriptional regulator, arsenate/arsenite/antimonite-responsive transcriptional repressor
MSLSEVFKSLCDETRLRILNLLTLQEICVCEIMEVLDLTQPNASKHLNKLKKAGIICGRKEGKWNYYSLNEKFSDQNRILYEYLFSQWGKDKQFIGDLQKLKLLLDIINCCPTQMQKYRELINSKKRD